MVGKLSEGRRRNPQADAPAGPQSATAPAQAQAWWRQCRPGSGSRYTRMIARIPVEAFVGLGANLEDPVQQVSQAVTELDGIDRTRLLAASSLYRSEPVGYAAHPPSTNPWPNCRPDCRRMNCSMLCMSSKTGTDAGDRCAMRRVPWISTCSYMASSSFRRKG